METPPNAPIVAQPKDISDADESAPAVTIQQQHWIDYNALNGLITDLTSDYVDKEGAKRVMRKMSIEEFAKLIGVDRSTLRRWRSTIPNFWQRVNNRRQELNPQGRLAQMHEVWFLSAMKAGSEGFRDRQLWLANFDENFRMPTEKVEHDAAGSLLDVLERARNTQRQIDQIQEGEIVDTNSPQANA